MINSKQAWSATAYSEGSSGSVTSVTIHEKHHTGEWLRIDAGESMDILGVMIQGRKHWRKGREQFLTYVRFEISDDDIFWT